VRALGAALLALVGLAVAADAQQPAAPSTPSGSGPRGWRHGPPGPPPIEELLERHADELGLDAALQAKIRDIAAQARQQAQPDVDQLRSLHEAMHQLLVSDSPDSQQVMSQADRIGAAETQLRKQRLATMLEIRALLTPEQRQKLVQIFEDKRARAGGRNWGPPGGCPPEPTPDAPVPPQGSAH
jgi:Spy/CpxP family protein refolding chaperone